MLEPQQQNLWSAFDYQPRTRVIFGPQSIQKVGQVSAELGSQHLLLVTDPGLSAVGHKEHVLHLLEQAGIHVTVFDQVTSNPTTEDVDHGLTIARQTKVDLIIGLGGGSSLDCAKGINFLLTNGGKMQDYQGLNKATKPMLPMIAIPTTAGTGSEAQSYALISDAETHQKMACGDHKAACKVALLDPELTLSLPPQVTAVTGIDALSHALESYVTNVRTPVSQVFSRTAWSYLARSFPQVIQDPQNLNARGEMLLGAHWAGAAIENSMLGITHSLANPLTAHLGLTHGVAVGIMLPHVIRYNGVEVPELYDQLTADIDFTSSTSSAAEKIAAFIESLLQLAELPTTISQATNGVELDESLLDQLSSSAAQQWTAQFNPRTADVNHFKELYQCAWTSSKSHT